MVNHVNTGLYILGLGQTPHDVSRSVYGDPSKYHILLKENQHSEWDAGDIIKVPNKKGRTAVVEQGETTIQFISRVFRGNMAHQYLDKYLLWNDGFLVEELVGTEVFIPER
jgi:hypothetical protein